MTEKYKDTAPKVILTWEMFHDGNHYTKIFIEEKNKDLYLLGFSGAYNAEPVKVDLPLNKLSTLTMREISDFYSELLKKNREKEGRKDCKLCQEIE